MRKQELKKLEIRVIAILLISIALLTIGLFYIKYNQYYTVIINELKEDAVNVHVFAENAIDERSFFDLNVLEDRYSELYITTHKQLDEIRRIANIRYLYTAKMSSDGELIYVVDGLDIDKDDEDFRNIGDLIEDEIIDKLLQCLNDEVVLGDSILDTEWGIVYVAYFPFHDSHGNVIGAIGMEFECEHVYHAINQALISTIILSIILAIITVIATLFILRKIVKSTEGDFRILDEAASDVHERAILMLDTSPLCIQIWDKNLNTIDCNEAGVRLYGFKDKQEYRDRFLSSCSPEFQPDGQRSDVKAPALVFKAFEEGLQVFDWMHKMPDEDVLIPAEITLVRSTYKGEDVVLGYTRDKRNEDKMLKEIEQRDRLLRAVNQTATMLLSSDVDEDLKKMLMNSMELIGNSIQADRIHIWRYIKTHDDVLLNNRYCWLSEIGAKKSAIPEDWSFSIKDWTGWVDQYENNICTNSPVSLLPPDEKDFFISHDVKSVVMIPLFLDNQLWGLFSIDDCVNERTLSEDEMTIMRSVSLMMASIITRHALIAKRTQDHADQSMLLTALFDAIPDHVFVKDFSLKYVQCNKSMYDFFGRTPEDIIGKDDAIGLGLASSLVDEFVGSDWLILSSGKTAKFEYVLPSRTGEPVHVETIKAPLVQNDKVIGILGISRDITDHKNMERRIAADYENARRLQAEADQANQSKSLFLASMSHEIRTPMNAILGATEVMMQSDDLPDDIVEWLGRIYNSGNLLLGIINDILDLSKIEAGKLHISSDNYQIASVINDAVQLNILRGEGKPIELVLKIDEKIPSTLVGDELRIKQILNNLLSNAFKFTDSGKITLSVNGEYPPNDDRFILVIRVRDTGYGMTKEQLDKLFEEYTRFDNNAGITIEGTGLGLAITQRLIYSMKGEIRVNSEPNKGTEFLVRLPQGTEGNEVLGKDVTESLKNFNYTCDNRRERRNITREIMPYGKVLVVDDVETNRFVAVGLLKIYKLQIDTVSSGYEAINRINDGLVYDVIFMDHMMPGIDGIETTKRLRDMDYVAPIVALTANVVSGQAEMFLENGFDDFIAKPIDIRELTTILNKHIRDKQPPDVIEAAREQEHKMSRHFTEIYLDSVSKGHDETQLASTKISGINIAKGLSRYEGDADTYIKILRSYAASVRAILEGISDITDETLSQFRVDVHSIKGASYDIFADSVGSKAEKLEHAAKSNDLDYINEHNTQFLKETWSLITEIEDAISVIDASSTKPEKDVPDREPLLRLLDACELYNMDDVDAAMAEINAFKYTADEGLSEWLRSNVDMMNFSEIVERLNDYL